MRHGLASGSRTIFPCACQPICLQPTHQQMAELERRLHAELGATPTDGTDR
jgi:hypothetical protein